MIDIFKEKYPPLEIEKNPFKCAEAIGWLKGVKTLCPSYETEGDFLIEIISVSMLTLLAEGDIEWEI